MKTTQMIVRMTVDEKALWKRVALLKDKTLSEWVRELVGREAEEVREREGWS